ncbi:MAG TPA: ABC transporter substrate-binding protein [Trueperaceae bacterium]|nr:ABC transporter substrate-binding protein [Trueperaceae bacterium]
MTRFRNSFRTYIGALAIVLVALGAASAWAQKVGGTVTIAVTEEPDTLDPQKTATAVTGTILRYIGDTLVTKDLNGNYTAGLAESWSASSDGLTWTFKLKPGIKFQDGTPVDAAAVKASFERALSPDTKSPIAGSLFAAISDIKVEGPLTLAITLSKPFSVFLDNFTDPRAAIVDVAAAKAEGNQFGRKPILTGPWMVSEWRSGDRIILKRNPNYDWGPSYAHKGAPYIDSLVFRIMPESATQVASFEAGEVQVLNTVPPANVQQLQGDTGVTLDKFLRKGVGLFMEFNTTKAPFDDIHVREALNYAVNKQAVVQVALKGLGVPAYGILPPSIWGYWDGIQQYAPHYDPEKAKSILEQDGWTMQNGKFMKNGQALSFTLYTAPIDTWTASAQVVQSMLKDVGVTMNIQTYEFGTLLSKLKAAEDQAHFMGYTYTSPDIVYLWFDSANDKTGLDLSHIQSPELDSLIAESRTETDNAARLDTYKTIQQFVSDQALWVPIWTNYNYIGVRDSLVGAKVHPEGYLSLLDAYVK